MLPYKLRGFSVGRAGQVQSDPHSEGPVAGVENPGVPFGRVIIMTMIET